MSGRARPDFLACGGSAPCRPSSILGLSGLKQIPLSLGPEPDYTFDTLLAGANTAALTHVLGLGAGAPPVFLWGPPGCGKTHVLRALAQRWQAAGAQVGWYDADTPLPWELPAHPSLLLL
ncbi:MAG: AAA family ATPase, partial [Rubrivivax sp.]